MIKWQDNDEKTKPGLYVVARSAMLGYHLEVAEKQEGSGIFVNSQWKQGVPHVDLVAELEEPRSRAERIAAVHAKKRLHPDEVYGILKESFISQANEYGVDITSTHCEEFLNDLYDQCYHCLSGNIPEEEL